MPNNIDVIDSINSYLFSLFIYIILYTKYLMQITHKCQYALYAYFKIKLVIVMNRLRDLREDHDLTQQKLADLLNCSQTTYSRYESEELNIPVISLKKLAKFYDTSIDYLVCLTNEKKPYKRVHK